MLKSCWSISVAKVHCLGFLCKNPFFGSVILMNMLVNIYVHIMISPII